MFVLDLNSTKPTADECYVFLNEFKTARLVGRSLFFEAMLGWTKGEPFCQQPKIPLISPFIWTSSYYDYDYDMKMFLDT